jgi:hypothetical protein
MARDCYAAPRKTKGPFRPFASAFSQPATVVGAGYRSLT